MNAEELRRRFGSHGAELVQQADYLSSTGWRAFAIMSDAKPCWERYHGARPYPARARLAMPWQTAERVGVALVRDQVVADIDCKHGKSGWEHFGILETAYGHCSVMRLQETPSGGAHRLGRAPASRPTGFPYPGQFLLPDGTPADIDLIHKRNRFVKVYDVHRWPDLRKDAIPRFSELWVPTMVKASPAPTVVGSTVDGSPVRPSTEPRERITLIAGTPEGNRTNTLNKEAFILFLNGYTDAGAVESLREAGRDCGLEETKVESTLQYAWAAAYRRWQPVEAWLTDVFADTHAFRLPERMHTRALAIALAERQLNLPGRTWIAFSVRDAAERLGVSAQAAAGHLRRLRMLGHLDARPGQRTAGQVGDLATEYRLARTRLDTSLPSPEGERQVSSLGTGSRAPDLGTPFGVAELPGSRAAMLLSHPAFQRSQSRDLPSLPSTAIPILLELESGSRTVTELKAVTGMSRTRLLAVLTKLDSAYIVDHHGEQVTLYYDDALEALDAWSAFMGLGARDEVRRERHNRDRLLRRQLHVAVEKVKNTRTERRGTSMSRSAMPTEDVHDGSLDDREDTQRGHNRLEDAHAS